MKKSVLEARRKVITGTDIAAIMGQNPYKGALEVYAEKVGDVSAVVENDAMYWGQQLEAVIAREYSRRNKVKLEKGGFRLHDKHKIVGGSPDRIVKGQKAVLEIKTAGLRQADKWGEEGTDEIPSHYLLQTAWYCLLTDSDTGEIAALIGGQDYRQYRYIRNPALEKVMLDAAERFWRDNILTKTPPEPTGTESCLAAIRELYPRNNGSIRAADDTDVELLEHLAVARKLKADAETQEAEIKGRLMLRIGELDGIEGDAAKVTWRQAADSERTDWKAVYEEMRGWLSGGSSALSRLEIARQRHTKTVEGQRRFLYTEKKKELEHGERTGSRKSIS